MKNEMLQLPNGNILRISDIVRVTKFIACRNRPGLEIQYMINYSRGEIIDDEVFTFKNSKKRQKYLKYLAQIMKAHHYSSAKDTETVSYNTGLQSKDKKEDEEIPF